MESYYQFDVVETIAKKQLTDPSAGIAGPTYDTKIIPAPGIQSISININRDKQILRGNGIIMATESSLDEVPVSLEVAKRDPEFEALLYGMAAWQTPTERNLALTAQSVPNIVGLWCRTNKVGANGKDVVVWVPSYKADTQQLQQQQRGFRSNQISGSAAFTTSTYPVIRDGVLSYEQIAWLEQLRETAAALHTISDSTAPTITSSNITGHVDTANIPLVASEALNPNTVNKHTILLKTGGTIGAGTLVDAEVTLASNGTDITINPAAALTSGATYNAYATTYVEDLAGNKVAAIDGITIAVA